MSSQAVQTMTEKPMFRRDERPNRQRYCKLSIKPPGTNYMQLYHFANDISGKFTHFSSSFYYSHSATIGDFAWSYNLLMNLKHRPLEHFGKFLTTLALFQFRFQSNISILIATQGFASKVFRADTSWLTRTFCVHSQLFTATKP